MNLGALGPLGPFEPLDPLDPLGELEPLVPLGVLGSLEALETLDPLEPLDPLGNSLSGRGDKSPRHSDKELLDWKFGIKAAKNRQKINYPAWQGALFPAQIAG